MTTKFQSYPFILGMDTLRPRAGRILLRDAQGAGADLGLELSSFSIHPLPRYPIRLHAHRGRGESEAHVPCRSPVGEGHPVIISTPFWGAGPWRAHHQGGPPPDCGFFPPWGTNKHAPSRSSPPPPPTTLPPHRFPDRNCLLPPWVSLG